MRTQISKYFTGLAFMGSLALVACGPSNVYEAYQAGLPLTDVAYKAGSTPQSRARDLTDCRVKSVQEVPQNLAIRTTPVRVRNGDVSCREIDGKTICRQDKPKVSGGETVSRDLNAGLRRQVLQNCLADSGYINVDIPVCPAGIAVTSQAGDAMPPLTARTCYRADPRTGVRFWNY